MKIRKAKKSDILPASKIVEMNYCKRYGNNSIKEILEMFSNSLIKPVYFVAEEKEKLLGFAGYIQSFMDYGVYQIFWVNVDKKNQRKGIGTKLVKQLINEIKKIKGKDKKAKMIQLTTTKPKFYERLGFKIISTFDKGEYLMEKKLK